MDFFFVILILKWQKTESTQNQVLLEKNPVLGTHMGSTLTLTESKCNPNKLLFAMNFNETNDWWFDSNSIVTK